MASFAWRQFLNFADDLTIFISSSNKESFARLRVAYKEVYDLFKELERPQSTENAESALPSLLVDGCADEQIWQQVELLNSENLKLRAHEIETTSVRLNAFEHGDGADEEDFEESSSEQSDNGFVDFDGSDVELNGSSEVAKGTRAVPSKGCRQSVVDDQFFSLDEMEQFADAPENNDVRNEVFDECRFFGEDDDNSSDQGVYYHDFFDPPEVKKTKTTGKKRVTFADEAEHRDLSYCSSDERFDHGENGIVRSSFELQQKRLKDRVAHLEEENLAPKPWELVGEVSGLSRPENSLLDKTLLFDRATRLPPTITPESTEKVEAIIKRRVKDRAWDDVERKTKPVNDLGIYKNELILDQQKSKLSLSQIYEQEYMKRTEKLEEERQCPAHEEIRKLLKDLFFKLDALTNFHYTPRPPIPEFAIVSNMPSIVMEEVAPVTVSDATMLAPEEVKKKESHEPSAPEENTETDRKRIRRKVKKMQSLRCKKQQSKDETRKRARVPNDKMQLLRKVGTVKKAMAFAGKNTMSSCEFFDRLTAQVKHVQNEFQRGKSQTRRSASSCAFKL